VDVEPKDTYGDDIYFHSELFFHSLSKNQKRTRGREEGNMATLFFAAQSF
jgi:hypothetical protein